jgi:hypothetical protein
MLISSRRTDEKEKKIDREIKRGRKGGGKPHLRDEACYRDELWTKTDSHHSQT